MPPYSYSQPRRSVDPSRFSIVPRVDVPRSTFEFPARHVTTLNTGLVVPVFVEEVLPGDSLSVSPSFFARLSTPLFPFFDNVKMDVFWFYCPYRLVWDNFKRFMGEQDAGPSASVDYIMPQIVSPVGGYAIGSVFDYMGLPTVNQVGAGNTVAHTSLPLRAYSLIWNEWFRDENLQGPVVVAKGDGPDDPAEYFLLARGKRPDYFTSALPWPKKPMAPLTTAGESQRLGFTWPDLGAPVSGIGVTGASSPVAGVDTEYTGGRDATPANQWVGNDVRVDQVVGQVQPNIRVLIEDIRVANVLQLMQERDARGGTRYTEKIFQHFGVRSLDARLQRPEYLGGGSVAMNMTPIAQTAPTAAASAFGDLAGVGTFAGGNVGFSSSFTEHGVVLGLVAVRADLTYQQGMRKMWSRQTQYDHFWPALAHLGEQAILSKELYCDGSAGDDDVFGYQERYSEYKHYPSMITGRFRSTAGDSLDAWHLSQEFGSRPTLNSVFIQESFPMSRVLAEGATATNNSQEVLLDAHFQLRYTRPMPMFAVPGLGGRF